LNTKNETRDAVESIFQHTDFPHELIVVDNGSVDKTVEVAGKFPTRTYVCTKRGQSSALNLGIKQARGDIICITNSDVVVPRDWLQKIASFLELHPIVEGIGGPVTPPLSGQRNDIERLTGDIYYEDQNFPADVTETQFGKVSGTLYSANCAYRKRSLVLANGFDETLLEFMDIDLCWRLVMMGSRLLFVPEIKVVHLVFPSTLTQVFRQQFRWGKGLATMTKRYRSDFDIYLEWGIGTAYKLTRTLLRMLFVRHHPRRKQVLRCFNYLAYDLGRLWGQK
jgi:GT2 family glycosyltransferase